MSTATLSRPPARNQLGVTQARVVRSEWIKFWSLRSTVVTLATAVTLLIGIGLLAASMLDSGAARAGRGTVRPGTPPPQPGRAHLRPTGLGSLGVLCMAASTAPG